MYQLRRAALFGLHFIAVYAVQKGTAWIAAIGILIAERGAIIFSVPAFAADHAGMAANTCIKINHKPQLAVGLRG